MESDIPSCGIMLVKLVLRWTGLTASITAATARRRIRNRAKACGELK
jgi:hypothetical protein